MREWLVLLRKKAGFTQEQVAEQSGLSQTYYSGIETGERGAKLPVNTAQAIAKALGFDWQKFYEKEVE